jgi:two-component sensor histidine kinase
MILKRPRLEQASNRIMAIGRAHDRLYRSPQVEKIELAEYLSNICHDLDEITPNYEVSFERLQPLFINTDRAIGVALVVTELVANAAKHAYPEETRGFNLGPIGPRRWQRCSGFSPR